LVGVAFRHFLQAAEAVIGRVVKCCRGRVEALFFFRWNEVEHVFHPSPLWQGCLVLFEEGSLGAAFGHPKGCREAIPSRLVKEREEVVAL
jgi:hypothetical protein